MLRPGKEMCIENRLEWNAIANGVVKIPQMTPGTNLGAYRDVPIRNKNLSEVFVPLYDCNEGTTP